MVDFVIGLAFAIVVVDVVVAVGGVEFGFDVFVSFDIAVTVFHVAFPFSIVVVDVHLLLPLFLL